MHSIKFSILFSVQFDTSFVIREKPIVIASIIIIIIIIILL